MANFKFVVNPTAARGKCRRVANDLAQLCRELNLDFDLTYTTKPGEATEIAYQARQDFENIIAVGGDGTVYETVNGIIGGTNKFGVIPVGSGNDFIKPLQIPGKLTDALNTVVNGSLKRIDIGRCDDRYFANGAGIGFDSWVVDASRHVTHLRGNAIYLYSVLKTIYSYRAPLMKLSYDDVQREEKIFMLTAGNGISLGGGFKLTPYAKMDDGLLDLNIVSDLTKLQVFQNLISVYSGSHTKMPQVTTARTTKLTIESDQGVAVHLDGELYSLDIKSLTISILPKALDVIVP